MSIRTCCDGHECNSSVTTEVSIRRQGWIHIPEVSHGAGNQMRPEVHLCQLCIRKYLAPVFAELARSRDMRFSR